MSRVVIYKITNLINNKVYVGKTARGVHKRFTEHCKQNKKSLIHKAIKKYSKENFIKEYSSAMAVRKDGYCSQHVWRCCSFKKRSAAGRFWFYKDTFNPNILQKYVDSFKFSGINFHKNIKKWTLTLKNKYLGCFNTKEQALEKKLQWLKFHN